MRAAGLCSIAIALLALVGCDLEAEPEATVVDKGSVVRVAIENTTGANIGISEGCWGHSTYQERLPGRWVPAPFFYCQAIESPPFRTSDYQIARPGEALSVDIPTSWVGELPAVVRGNYVVRTGCTAPENGLFDCEDSTVLTTDPVLLVEPGTADTVGNR